MKLNLELNKNNYENVIKCADKLINIRKKIPDFFGNDFYQILITVAIFTNTTNYIDYINENNPNFNPNEPLNSNVVKFLILIGFKFNLSEYKIP
tara:strand:+ start:143 stop:424 length:282 start_codon:yes stop_codon:yes gene_type:complete